VRYGDTDSVFVQLPGRSLATAFAIGAEIVRAVNRSEPRPIELELEKVYMPCILASKKRYVGYAYSSPTQQTPEFDAKGIETVRRDSCPLVSTMVEKSLRTLFESRDLSRVKRYCLRQWRRLQLGQVSLSQLLFRKEVRLGSYRDGGPAAAVVAARAMQLDRMAEPRYGQRVEYLVVCGTADAPLRERCQPPMAVIHDPSLIVDTEYYIRKQILPSLARLLNLVGCDPAHWYNEMPLYRAREGHMAGIAVAPAGAGGGWQQPPPPTTLLGRSSAAAVQTTITAHFRSRHWCGGRCVLFGGRLD
jgi:DNA polymerase zeta